MISFKFSDFDWGVSDCGATPKALLLTAWPDHIHRSQAGSLLPARRLQPLFHQLLLFHFLIPVVSAATIFDLTGVVLVTFIAAAAYFSFLLPVFVDWNTYHIEDYLGVTCLRVSFWAIVAFVVYEQARGETR